MAFEFIERPYTEDEIVRELPDRIAKTMFTVFVNWPVWELEISSWLILVSGVDPHVGPILLGNMETKAKLDRLKSIYKHMQAKEMVQYLGRVSKRHEDYAQVRNVMTHNAYAGYLRDRPDVALFKTYRAAPGNVRLGTYALQISLDTMEETAAFARNWASAIGSWLETLHEQRERQFREGPPPTQPHKSRSKRREPPQPPRE